MRTRLISILAATLVSVAAFAQLSRFAPGGGNVAPDETVSWQIQTATDTEDPTVLILTLEGEIVPGWHIYGIDSEEYNPTRLTFDNPKVQVLALSASEPGDIYTGRIRLEQRLRPAPGQSRLSGSICWQACKEEICAAPETYDFDLPLTALPLEDKPSAGQALWSLILEALLWGFAMLLTPCVFPMVPMTVSFFLKGSSSPAAGRFKALMYGLFIVLLYTVPISIIIGLTRLIGGDAVTADIFNWLATHWLPNLIFFVVFMLFAASFFGAFEITLPSSLVNKSDRGSDRGGLVGVFFMALTLVLVSFSCTGPIVGTVLIKSTQGEFWTPMVTMLAFSLAFALPFTLFALFPTLLKKLRSGSWMNSVKVVLGFIEIALGFKFLSTADQAYQWGLLDREVYLAIWIVCFALLGLYLLGKIRFKYDDPLEKIGVVRLGLAIAVFSFVIYMIPGMFGAPLKTLSGYLPPLDTQDFVLGTSPVAQPALEAKQPAGSTAERYQLSLPYGLQGYFKLEEGLAASRETGKAIFLDITGKACTNCREMESRVWSDPRVLKLLREDFVIVSLFVDIHREVPPEEWLTLPSGKVLKEFGSINARLVKDRFGVNAQPNYIILNSDGEPISPIRGYNLDIEAYLQFLQDGLRAFSS